LSNVKVSIITVVWNNNTTIKNAIDSVLDHERLRKLLIQIVLGFKSQCEINDILYKDK